MKRALVALALFGVSACAVGPTYRTPALPPKGEGAFVSAEAQISAAGAPPVSWWRLYDDPVLDGLIQRAFAANTDLRAAQANLSAARGVLDQARAGLFPSTTLSGAATYGRSASADSAASSAKDLRAVLAPTNADTGLLGPNHATAEWSYDPAFDVSYELDLFGRVRRTIEASRSDYQSTQAALDAVKITVAAETARAYSDGCAYGEEVDAANRTLKVLQSTYDIALVQRDAGAASDFDVARAGALLEQAGAAVPTLEGLRRASLFELAALIGVTPSEVPAEAAACRAPPKITALLPVGDGAGLLRRRPDVREAERRLAAETARIGVAEADLFPTVTLGGSIGAGASQYSNLFATNNVSFGIGPLINWSFPNILAARGRIKSARAAARAALANFDGAVLTALKETEQALAAYNGELLRRAALQRGLDDSQRAFDLADTRYTAGSASYLDLLTTEQTLITAQSSLAASDQAVAADQIAVFKALGGGWQSTAQR